ncbi:unnamed protein product [Peronospora destructor]|uniref:Secreted protein n=1 Tax=Peronospora destructor TaxID=86335 RepID=A0AAV0UCH8_9STRA|nr:unnamed protein product [Peronospora destructor]
MVQWKLVCGLAGLCVVGLVKGSPIQEDDRLGETESTDCISLGADGFTGAGKEISGKPKTVACAARCIPTCSAKSSSFGGDEESRHEEA